MSGRLLIFLKVRAVSAKHACCVFAVISIHGTCTVAEQRSTARDQPAHGCCGLLEAALAGDLAFAIPTHARWRRRRSRRHRDRHHIPDEDNENLLPSPANRLQACSSQTCYRCSRAPLGAVCSLMHKHVLELEVLFEEHGLDEQTTRPSPT